MSRGVLVQAFAALEPDYLRSLWEELQNGAEVFFGPNADEDWMTEEGVP